MGTVTAKQLKQKTGEVIRRVKSGGRLTLTYRGKEIATICPPAGKSAATIDGLRPFDKAWDDIEQALEQTEPEFKGWREAMSWVRNNHRF